MSLILDILKATGPNAIMSTHGLPHALAANFQAAGFTLTEQELWTDPSGKIYQHLKQILFYLQQLPELAEINMDKTLAWLTHMTGVHYKHLMKEDCAFPRDGQQLES